MCHSGFDPMSTSCGASPRSSVRSEPSRNTMRRRGCASAHSWITRCSANGSAPVIRRPACVRHQFGPGGGVGPVARRRRDEEPEVDRVEVRVHDHPVAPVIDRVLDVVAPRGDEDRLAGGVVGGQEPHLAARLARRLDDHEVVGPGLAEADEVPLVGLLEDERVDGVGRPRTDLVPPDPVRPLLLVGGDVEQVPPVA